jgi:hypothetical protein
MTDENQPVDFKKSRISMNNINGIPLKEARISYADLNIGHDSRMSYVNISNQVPAQAKKTGTT